MQRVHARTSSFVHQQKAPRLPNFRPHIAYHPAAGPSSAPLGTLCTLPLSLMTRRAALRDSALMAAKSRETIATHKQMLYGTTIHSLTEGN